MGDILLCFSRVKDVKNPRRMSSSSVPCQADQLLIEQVRSHKVLYAVATKSNRDNQLRDRAWMEIARTLERSVEDSKERWRYMRDRYVKDVGKYRRSLRHYDQEETENLNEMSFMSLMAFLNPYIRRKLKPALSSRSFVWTSQSENGYSLQNDESQAGASDVKIEFVSTLNEEASPDVSDTNSTSPKETNTSETLRRTQETTELDDDSPSEAEDLKAAPARHKKQRVQDPTELFCATIGSMLKELKTFHREKTKQAIYNLVSEAVLSELVHQT